MLGTRSIIVLHRGHSCNLKLASSISGWRHSSDKSTCKPPGPVVSNKHYDLVVIGGGPAGFAAAMRGYDYGKKIAVIEKTGRSGLGGASIFHGVLASKTLWQLGRSYQMANSLNERHGRPPLWPAFGEVREQVNIVMQKKTAQIMEQINWCHKSSKSEAAGGNLTREQRGAGTVDLIGGTAKFVDSHTLQVSGVGAVTADNFVIATGSRPRILKNLGMSNDGSQGLGGIITSDGVLGLPRWPKSMLILGAGVIGCEYSTIFSNFGQTKVHLVNERRSRLLPTEDMDLTDLVTSNLESAGVTVHNDVKMMSATKTANGMVEVILGRRSKPGLDEWVPDASPIIVETVLASVGRVPNVEGLGLEVVGVNIDPKTGGIIATAHALTTAPEGHIFAAGDVTADIGLVNVAEMEARHAVECIFEEKKTPILPLQYENISSIIFADPEVACVGINEQEARKRGIPHRVAVYGFDTVNRNAINAAGGGVKVKSHGFIKMVVTDDANMRLLGMRAVGEDSSAIIETASFLIMEGTSVRTLEKCIHPHPAITEAVQECVRLLLGRSIYKGTCFGYTAVRSFRPDDDHVSEKSKSTSVPTYT